MLNSRVQAAIASGASRAESESAHATLIKASVMSYCWDAVAALPQKVQDELKAIASPPTAASPTLKPRATARTYRVTKVVDGDTVVVSSGQTVRLIGIDAPDSRQCGYSTAKSLLSGYVLGKNVTLTAGAATDKDRYGRLLRYVNIGSFDPGLKLIQVGRAIARYDSRDGYGAHPRESQYVRADAASRNANVCTTTKPKPAPAPAPLVPQVPKSVYYANCSEARAAGVAPLYRGEPGYRSGLDRDGDGVACE